METNNFNLQSLENCSSESKLSVSEIATAIGSSELYVNNVAGVMSESTDADGSFSCKQVMQFILRAYNNLPSWLISISGKRVKRSRMRLKYFRALCLYLVEESNIFMDLPEEERLRCRGEIALVLDAVDDFLRAEKLMEPGYYCNPESFVEKVMTKLQKTGYVYKVEETFRRMIALFRIMPDLMNDKMPQLTDIMLMGDTSNWHQEELRLQLMNLLGHYIQTNRASVDTIADFESKHDQDLLVTMIKALAMQLYLYDPMVDTFDYNLNRSTLYRYASHTRIATNSTDTLLDKSYACLIGCIDTTTRLEYTWEQIRSVDLMVSMLQSSVDIKKAEPMEFQSAASTIRFSKDSIEIQENVSDNRQIKVVASGIIPWHGMKIRMATEHGIKVSSFISDVDRLQCWWKETEKILTSVPAKSKKKTAKRRAYIGEKVDIVIDGVADEERGIFRCHIKDDKIEGRGTIAVHEIVSYKIRPEAMLDVSRLAFVNPENGRQSLFEANVISDDGTTMEFSVKKLLNEFISDQPEIGYGYKTSCVITSLNVAGQIAIGVSADGIPVILPYEETICVGDFYAVSVMQAKNNKQGVQLLCEKTDGTPETVTQDKAIVNLLIGYGIEDDAPEETKVQPQAKQIPQIYVDELVRLIDRESMQQVDVHRRYNYLCAAKLIAHIIGNENSVEYFENRITLQKLLYDFSKNETIDRDKLTRLEQLESTVKSQYPILRVRIKELHVLDCLDKLDRNAGLFAELQSETNSELKRLINLVLAYNHLAGFELSEQRQTILQQINSLLKVKIQVQDAHYFGEEDDQKEFKSSVVYIANAEGKHIPDIEQQSKVILKEVCAFLNTKGGTLYIGVNDYGYAQGLDLDMQWFQLHKMWHVTDMDEYRQHVVNMLCRKWPALKDVFDVTFPSIKGHQVVAVKVPPCKTPVDLDGDYYCRVGSECRKITEEGLDGFKDRRSMQYEQYMSTKH